MVGFCDFTGFDYGPVSKNMAVKCEIFFALLTTSCGLLALGLGLTSYIPDRSPV